jgi:hypothetical protein
MKIGDTVKYIGKQLRLQGVLGVIARKAENSSKPAWYVSFASVAEERSCFESNLELVHKYFGGSADLKPTNPKDAIGTSKLPLDLVPDTMEVFAATAFAEGALKYGSTNWRVAGVRASIYYAAMKRHMKKWWNGENCDKDSKVHHLASVMACAAIVLDAEVVGMLTDDRPPKADITSLIDSLESTVKHLKELHKDKNPVHHTNAK